MTTRFSFVRSLLKPILRSILPAVLIAGATMAAPPAGYYDSVDTSTPETLRSTLHAVIDGHTKIPYTSSSTDTWDVLELADEDPLNASNILDVYRNRTYVKVGGGNTLYNREHTWPKGYGFPNDGSTNLPYTDCHHLFLCDIGYNSTRESRVYDDCTFACNSYPADTYNGESGTNLSQVYSPVGVWETWAGRRGDVARAQFYMDVRYEGGGTEPDLILTDDVNLILASQTGSNEAVAYMGMLVTLLQWNLDDPVDDKERNRNDVVYAYQGNRNPFIDHPEWVEAIFDPATSTAGATPVLVPIASARISSASPNPFNPSTRISFFVGQSGFVQIDLYSVTGSLVRNLLDESRRPGDYEVMWNGRNAAGEPVASGLYFCRLRSGDETDMRKLMLVR